MFRQPRSPKIIEFKSSGQDVNEFTLSDKRVLQAISGEKKVAVLDIEEATVIETNDFLNWRSAQMLCTKLPKQVDQFAVITRSERYVYIYEVEVQVDVERKAKKDIRLDQPIGCIEADDIEFKAIAALAGGGFVVDGQDDIRNYFYTYNAELRLIRIEFEARASHPEQESRRSGLSP